MPHSVRPQHPKSILCQPISTQPRMGVQAFEMMEKELGRPIAQIFSSISERPIAAASLGQVSITLQSILCAGCQSWPACLALVRICNHAAFLSSPTV